MPRLRRPDIDTLDRLCSAIYDGPLESPPWSSALQLLREVLKAKHVTLILRPPSAEAGGAMINTDTVLDAATQSYQAHYFALDPFVGLPEDHVVTPEDLFGKGWRESPLYREYLAPLDVEHLIGADIHTPDGIECRFRVSRSRQSPPFSVQDKALCKLFLPHLKRSIQLHARFDEIECDRHLFAGVISRLQLGMITYAGDGVILDINPEARRILARQDGVHLSGGTLCFDGAHEGREFRRLLRETLAGAVGKSGPTLLEPMLVARPSGQGRLVIVIRAAPSGRWSEAQQRPAAVVLLRDPESGGSVASHEIVQRLFGMTQMEAALALHLAEGLTLEETAAKLGVTKNTARTYLRFIFRKTGVTRQSMLIRKLLNSVATLG